MLAVCVSLTYASNLYQIMHHYHLPIASEITYQNDTAIFDFTFIFSDILNKFHLLLHVPFLS